MDQRTGLYIPCRRGQSATRCGSSVPPPSFGQVMTFVCPRRLLDLVPAYPSSKISARHHPRTRSRFIRTLPFLPLLFLVPWTLCFSSLSSPSFCETIANSDYPPRGKHVGYRPLGARIRACRGRLGCRAPCPFRRSDLKSGFSVAAFSGLPHQLQKSRASDALGPAHGATVERREGFRTL